MSADDLKEQWRGCKPPWHGRREALFDSCPQCDHALRGNHMLAYHMQAHMIHFSQRLYARERRFLLLVCPCGLTPESLPAWQVPNGFRASWALWAHLASVPDPAGHWREAMALDAIGNLG